jgi:hypothetical protein
MISSTDEDSKYWYAAVTKGKKIVDKMRYSKLDSDYMGEK